MTALSDRKYVMQVEETKFNAGLTESLMSRMGSLNNFLANREMSQHDFNLNGRYNLLTLPAPFADGYITYPFAFEVLYVCLFSAENNGTSGTTEIDVKWAPFNGAYSSMLSTTPKFTSVGANKFVYNGGPAVTGMVNPVLSKTQFDAWDSLKLDVLQARSGLVDGVFVKIFVRPRDDA